MLKALYVGFAIVCAICLVAAVMQDANIIFVFSGAVAVICFILSGIFSGALNNGDANRAHFHTESKQQRRERTGLAGKLFFVALPNVAAFVFMYIFYI
ncbi:DUF5316 domain-containing protein [Evansella halocellulosilytica]|uniref:DUF5316 domain-containing protein n=1 Tax=Evansella halocellulosilytica TaxID=2011013 RepID=UPI000BB71E70|nr:DUF5316 domain-containing protein [Evansella halocellulosilytica]